MQSSFKRLELHVSIAEVFFFKIVFCDLCTCVVDFVFIEFIERFEVGGSWANHVHKIETCHKNIVENKMF